MIVECLIFLSSFVPVNGITIGELEHMRYCKEITPDRAGVHFELIQEFFEPENQETAVKIAWSESRFFEYKVRTAEGNYDTGLFQFIRRTWNWVADEYNLPRWNEWVVLRYGQPYEGPTSKSSHGFSFVQVQKSAYYNTLFASLLSQDIYNRTRWDDWSSSQWCWEDTEKFLRLVYNEEKRY